MTSIIVSAQSDPVSWVGKTEHPGQEESRQFCVAFCAAAPIEPIALSRPPITSDDAVIGLQLSVSLVCELIRCPLFLHRLSPEIQLILGYSAYPTLASRPLRIHDYPLLIAPLARRPHTTFYSQCTPCFPCCHTQAKPANQLSRFTYQALTRLVLLTADSQATLLSAHGRLLTHDT